MKKGKLLLFLIFVLSFFTVKVDAKGYIGHTVQLDQEYEMRYVTDEEKARIMESFGLASWDGSVLVHYHDYENDDNNIVSFKIDYSRTNLNTSYPTIEDYLMETGEDDPYYDDGVIDGYYCVGVREYEYSKETLFDFKRNKFGKIQFSLYPTYDPSILYDNYVCGERDGFREGIHYTRYYFQEEGLSLLAVDGDSGTMSYLVFYEVGNNTRNTFEYKDDRTTMVDHLEAMAIRDFDQNIYMVRKKLYPNSSLMEGTLSENDIVEFKHSLGIRSDINGYSSLKLLPVDGYSFSIDALKSTFIDEDVIYITTSYGRFSRDDEYNELYLNGEMFSLTDKVIYGRRYHMDDETWELVDLELDAFDTLTLPKEEDALVEYSYYDPKQKKVITTYEQANFIQVTYHTMNGQDLNYFYTYDTEENREFYNFVSIDPETVDDTYDTFIYDIEEKLLLSQKEMQSLVNANQYGKIEIRSVDGVSFVFKQNSMTIVPDVLDYDFRVTIERDFALADVTGIESDDFIARVNYQYSGQLPGPANIKIFIGMGYSNSEIYYGQYENGEIIDPVKYVADGSGYVTVTQDHCSDYVLYVADGNMFDDPPVGPPVEDGVRGDFSGDGEVNFSDVVIGLRKVFGYAEKTELDSTIGDLNGNGDLDFSDIIILLRYVFGYITEI